jgi:hypothetical protein
MDPAVSRASALKSASQPSPLRRPAASLTLKIPKFLGMRSSQATSYQACAPKLAAWLEQSVPEGLAVFSLPESHQKRMRTSNPIERSVQQEVKRRTVKVRVFPNEDSLLRLVSAILV